MKTLMLLALFLDLWIPEPYLMWIDVIQNPPVKVITKAEAWERIHKPHKVTPCSQSSGRTQNTRCSE